MSMLSVADARARVLEGVAVLPFEDVPLAQADGRTLSQDLAARRAQPPFDASAMDGYAVGAEDATDGAILSIIGEAPAGRAFERTVGPGEAVRIFTGAPVPTGADAVLIQENTAPAADGYIRVTEPVARGRNIRVAGLDFEEDAVLLRAGSRLNWRTVALAAAMNYPTVPVIRRPRIAILATGDELVRPGEAIGPDQIVASNSFGLAAFVANAGAVPIDLGIVRDDRDELIGRIGAAMAMEPDVLVTLGGASVGDHDLVREALGRAGLDLGFWKVAMRPGKPLMFGRLGSGRVLGLPGNPVSSLVGAVLFLGPLIGALMGRDVAREPATTAAVLGADLKPNDQRADYVRASLAFPANGLPIATAFETQDSSMLGRFAACDCLILREPFAGAAKSGDEVAVIRL